jgi:hypothetical protein
VDSQAAGCQVKVHTDSRLDVLKVCGRPGTGLIRVSCARIGHAEELVMCRRCMHAIMYCEPCMREDRMLVRAVLLALA